MRSRFGLNALVPFLLRHLCMTMLLQLGLNGVRLQIVQDTRKKFFRFGQKAIFTCTMVPSISEKIFESVLYWRLFDNGSELQQPRIDTSNLQPGKYNSSCWSSSLTFSVSRLFYIIGKLGKSLHSPNSVSQTNILGMLILLKEL